VRGDGQARRLSREKSATQTVGGREKKKRELILLKNGTGASTPKELAKATGGVTAKKEHSIGETLKQIAGPNGGTGKKMYGVLCDGERKKKTKT